MSGRAAPIPLTPEQQAVVAANRGLAWRFAQRYITAARSIGMAFEDVVGHAYVGLCVAAQQHNPAKGAFSTWAWWRMRSVVSRAVDRHGRAHDRVLLASQLGDGDFLDSFAGASEDPADQVEAGELPDVGAALDELPPRLRTVLVQRFGLDGAGRRTLRETAGGLGVTRERVRQLEDDALVEMFKALRRSNRVGKQPAGGVY